MWGPAGLAQHRRHKCSHVIIGDRLREMREKKLSQETVLGYSAKSWSDGRKRTAGARLYGD
jgi:hypothetical protein